LIAGDFVFRYRMSFRHRDLLVYKEAKAWTREAFALSMRIPHQYAELSWQLRRAALSIPLNIAEGSAEPLSADQFRFFRYARRSAAECDACVDIMHEEELIDADAADHYAGRLNRISAMLQSMMRPAVSYLAT
jgi:four helix bundle protein